ncbi:dienelactone hydrolase family protein [Gammaproteobacteria bacterium]|nr:dienelactone hydrolase family protein [Gammaproteobacteria bacterium]
MKVFQIIFLPFLLYACSQSAEIEQTYLTEKIEYSSKNILGFENLFGDGLTSQKNVKIYGVLHFPDNYDSHKKYPAIIASHGSSNWRAHHLRYLEQMRQAGFIVLAMHPFDSRGVDSTVGNQINVTSETVIYDMAMSLNLLWDDSRINNNKIYAAGWSLGGTATLFNGWLPLQHSINKNGASFAGYLMWYPGCLALPDLNEWDKDLMQIYIGEEDNWTPPQPCKELVADINLQGGNAFIELYPNSFHSFDGPQPLRLIPDAYSWAECKLKLNADTKKVYDPKNTMLDFSDPKLRRAAYESCAVKGEVMAGASPEYKNAAYQHLSQLLPRLD